MWNWNTAQRVEATGVHRGQLPTDPMPDDIEQALSLLTRLLHDQHPEVVPLFDSREPLIATRAPGRLDVMGGIADYSGSTVLQLPLSEAAVVLCQTTSDSMVRVISTDTGSNQVQQSFYMPIEHFFHERTGAAQPLSVMRGYFSALDDDQQWGAYVAGILPVLMEHCGLRLQQGLVVFVHSTVPIGKGVSSSAAIEVASMRAIAHLSDLDIDAHQQAVLCQRVENHIVGAPCGLMDQMTSSLGRKDALLRLRCQPDIMEEAIELPENLSVWGIDSGVRHHVSGSDYTDVRVAAFIGYRIILQQAGIADAQMSAKHINDTRWNGYLANVTVKEFETSFTQAIPDSMSGKEFLSRFDATTDTVTAVDPDGHYEVRACTAHPVYEHERVRSFAQLASKRGRDAVSADVAQKMGACMYQSHASYSTCGIGSPGTDELVRRIEKAGIAKGIYGARITGGGSGGTVAVLADRRADSDIREIAAEYALLAGMGGQVFSGSSDGASVWTVPPDS